MHCAVAVLETPHAFILEGTLPRPERTYPELRFWGGKVEEHEETFPEIALDRELYEELGLRSGVTEEGHVWTGYCQNQTRDRRVITPLFALFHVRIDSVDNLTVQPGLQSRIVEVPKRHFEKDKRLTHFARQGLRKFLDPSYTIEREIERRAA